MSSRKAELRAAALGYLLKHGMANASLRPMAAELGTSARILIFHFKSKEGLLQEVMQELTLRLQRSFEDLVRSPAAAHDVPPLKRFWQWAMRAENLPQLRLLYEVQIIAAQNPAQFGAYLRKASSAWQQLALESMSAALRSSTLATLCIAVFDGLMLELMTTGEHERLSAALDEFIALGKARTRAKTARSARAGRARRARPLD